MLEVPDTQLLGRENLLGKDVHEKHVIVGDGEDVPVAGGGSPEGMYHRPWVTWCSGPRKGSNMVSMGSRSSCSRRMLHVRRCRLWCVHRDACSRYCRACLTNSHDMSPPFPLLFAPRT